MAKQDKDKEKCSKCGSEDFSVALKNDKPDPSGKRYCQKCQHVWVPGLEGMKRPDVVLAQAQKEVRELRESLDAERKAHAKTKEELAALRLEVEGAIADPSESEIFS